MNAGQVVRVDPAPIIADEVECIRRAIIWIQRFQARRRLPPIDPENPPQWVDEILNMPWMAIQIPMAKRYRAYRHCARHLRYTKRQRLPKELVMAIRC